FIPGVLALPETVTDDDARRATATPIIRRRKQAPQHRLNTQHVEKISAHPERPRTAYLAPLREIETTRAPGKDSRESLLPISDLLPDRIGDGWIPGAFVSARSGHIRWAHFGQFLRRFDGQRAQ